jgi:CRISPR-associated protein Cmr5
MSRQTVEQERAAQALKCVNEARGAGEYGSLARKAPADIQSNGLGQTLAFWRSKGWEKSQPKHNGHTLIYNHLSEWVCKRMGWDEKAKPHGLLDWLTTCTTADYRRATAEAQAFLVWLKRFAEAELE